VNGNPHLLTPIFHEKIWGTEDIAPWFSSQGKKIGEVWLQSLERTLPILVKFIFTADKLSVQVHPDDNYAMTHGVSAGKSEMWHVLRAAPGANIAVGLKHFVSRALLRQAALSGEIETMLNWLPVKPGDTIMVHAGTIHAIGAGVALCEIQQSSDVTYRLYDYGRPRELHLDKALEVVHPGPHPGISMPVALSAEEFRLAACKHFVTELLQVDKAFTYFPDPARLHILIAMDGKGSFAGKPFTPGMAWAIDPGEKAHSLQPQGICRLLRTYLPPASHSK